jgi:hypothetical protein
MPEITTQGLMRKYRIDKSTVARIAKEYPDVRIYDKRGKPRIGLYDADWFDIFHAEYKSRSHSIDKMLTKTRPPVAANAGAPEGTSPPVTAPTGAADDDGEVSPPPTEAAAAPSPPRPRGRPPGGGALREVCRAAPGEAEPVTVAERAALARLAKAEAEAERSRLKARQEAGELVSREAVKVFAARVATEARQRLESIPAKLARTLVGLPAPEIEAAIRAEIKAALTELARIEAPPS